MEDNSVLESLATAWQAITDSALYQALVSEQARRVYVFALAFAISLFSVYTARKPFIRLHRSTSIDTLRRVLTYRGSKPSTPRGIARRRQRIRDDARAYSMTSLGRIGLIFALGVIVPLISVLTIAWIAPFLFPGHAVLIDADTRQAIDTPAVGDLAVFTVDMILKGALNDVAEVYELNFGAVRHASDNILFGLYVLMFRLVADFFVIGLILYAGRTLWNWHSVTAGFDKSAVVVEGLEE